MTAVMTGCLLLAGPVTPEAAAGDADLLLERLAEHAAFDQLEHLGALRQELEKSREAAMKVIFNPLQYDVPGPEGSSRFPFDLAQKELTSRLGRLRQLWDDPTRVSFPLSRDLATLLSAAEAAVAVAQERGISVPALQQAAAWRTLLVSQGPLGVRTYFASTSEYARMRHTQRIREEGNRRLRGVVEPWVADLVAEINDYRAMLGYAACIRPYHVGAFDAKTVSHVFDKAVVTEKTSLYALRISTELVRAADAHSRDAETRDYRQLRSPPDPATGTDWMGPDDWARRHGYDGDGVDAVMFCEPDTVLDRFEALCGVGCSHRLLLGAYLDIGVGRAGDVWMIYVGRRYWICQ